MNKTKPQRILIRRKRIVIPALILIVIIAFRIYLPFWVKDHVNKVLADIPGYYGQVDDIEIALLRGAYVINGMYLNKVESKTQVPFLNFPNSDISIEWKSLFKGKIVSEIIMYDPEVIYVFEDHEDSGKDESAKAEDWTKALTDLVPIEINHFEAHRGKVAFVELQADPDIDLSVSNVELTADNLRNVVRTKRVLPSPISATGISVGDGTFKLDGELNLIKEIPDMDMEFSLERANVTALNDFTRHYAGIDFESGTFELFSEIAIADGHLKGYLKPLLKDSKLIGKEDGFLGVLWEGFVGFFKFALKNQKTGILATKIPIEGDLNNVDAGVWPTVFNIFKNAWIDAFSEKVDGNIEFKDAFTQEELSKEDKKELRQERRDARRKERRMENN